MSPDQALERLARLDERLCAVVGVRFIGAMREEETAELLRASSRTTSIDRVKARTWWFKERHPEDLDQSCGAPWPRVQPIE